MNAKTIILSLCVATLATTQATAQFTFRMHTNASEIQKDTIGEVQLLVQYETHCIANIEKPENVTEETMMLETGKNLSKFYSYTQYICDSVLTADFANNASQEIMNEHLKQYGTSKLSERTFKGYPTGKVTTLDEIAGMTRLRCEEPEERPQWKVLAENDSILSYLCVKAECQFKGRTWTAWFAPEIPVSDGPWKLYGLPGLILKAEDSEGHYSFTATGIEQCHTYRPVIFDGKEYEPVNRKAYEKVHERYYADPVGFIVGSMPNVTITIKDEQGNKAKNPKNISHNPLERNKKLF
ncbi:GLPGLI family protein [Bacteroides sp. UBA939]|uniref:GLPGLI family protein n=1 Tax=Bacteroides sp. UBA939 TaxID=1946092 RepID=UPI0025C59038|nr:GLPGLI family protein [Bacteroides sp. UBA939]